VRGDSAGSVSVVANYTQPGGATFEDVSTLTINAPIPTPSISINDVTVTEGDTGSQSAHHRHAQPCKQSNRDC
jgi:hypothetical protein